MYNKITLIKPNMHSSKSKGAMQPLFAAAIAAHTPNDFEIKLYDARIEDIPYNEPTDLVAISIETFCARSSYEIASEFRERGVKVIAGGYHPTILPNECLQYVDSILIGDLEDVWLDVVLDLKNNSLKKIYKSDNLINKNPIKFKRDIFKNKSYGPIELVQWGRGCCYNCEFCSIKSFYKSQHYCRPVEHVVEEISNLTKKNVFFVDDNLFQNKKKLILFLNEIKLLRIKWICQISITIAQDNQILKLMRDSGCFVVLIGIESFNPANLKLMNKQWNNSKLNFDEAITKIKAHGMLIYGTFIFGYDHDTLDSFKYAYDFALKHNFFIANFNPLYPIPKTQLYYRYEKEKRLNYDNWWLDKNFYYGKSMFTPVKISSEQLENSCYELKLKFNSWKSIINRGVGLTTSGKNIKNLALFFYANYINRKEIIVKQGKSFGKKKQ